MHHILWVFPKGGMEGGFGAVRWFGAIVSICFLLQKYVGSIFHLYVKFDAGGTPPLSPNITTLTSFLYSYYDSIWPIWKIRFITELNSLVWIWQLKNVIDVWDCNSIPNFHVYISIWLTHAIDFLINSKFHYSHSVVFYLLKYIISNALE